MSKIPEPGNSNTDSQLKRTFCPLDYRDDIIKMMENHLCAHPLIPGYSAPSSAGIRQWAVKEMYGYCERHDLREVWAYLWENWYRHGRWELWARSCATAIPRLKTTMIMESQYVHLTRKLSQTCVNVLPAGVALSTTFFIISINRESTCSCG